MVQSNAFWHREHPSAGCGGDALDEIRTGIGAAGFWVACEVKDVDHAFPDFLAFIT
jgi:hypothetical protein